MPLTTAKEKLRRPRAARRHLVRASLLLTLAGCAGPSAQRATSPVTLDYALTELPDAGLCRIEGGPNRSCRGISYMAPAGSRILYRLRGESNLVAVCYMDRTYQGKVYGIDLYDAYKRWLVLALLTAYEEPQVGDCDEIVHRLYSGPAHADTSLTH